jgi:VWFA-related protein
MCNLLPVRITLALVAAVCFFGALFTKTAQTQTPANQQNDEKVVVNKDEVLFDVVVRDKKGKPIRDLAATDFEVYEDGVKQNIDSFRFVSSIAGEDATATNPAKNTAETPSGPKPTTGIEPAAGVSAVAIVFDRLTAESRPRAREAALSYLGESVKKNELVGVFLTDLSVRVLQPFTYDTQLVKAGIEKAGELVPSLYTSNNEQARAARESVTLNLMRISKGQKQPEPNTESIPAQAATMLSLLDFVEQMQRDQQGNATAHGLLHIAAALRAIPGRKAVIFFSEGLTLPPNVLSAFQSVISEANRGNVSFYAVDVGGLRTESKTAETRKEVNSRSDLRMAQVSSTSDPNGPMLKDLERNEDLLRLNPESGLTRLANDTGGFLITDTNDLGGRLQKVDEDLHSYYLLSYNSNNQKYDGHFRKIEVKLKRSGLSVQSRKGYYAIKGAFGSPVLAYEAPALAALDSKQKPDSFPFYASAFTFPDRERTGLTPLIVDVPISAFTVRVDQSKKVYDTDFCLVTLVKDQSGQVIAKLSEHYQLNGPSDKAEDTKKERVLFYREANLPPGRYTLESIAYDAPSGRASVRTGTIEVPVTDENKVRLSDVALLNRAAPAGAEEGSTNPFRVANMIVSPNLGEPIQRSRKQVPFYFTVNVPPGLAKPNLTIEVLNQGKSLTQMPGELPASDASGRIQFVAGLPVEKLPAGAYELKITVSGEGISLSRSRSFTIVD